MLVLKIQPSFLQFFFSFFLSCLCGHNVYLVGLVGNYFLYKFYRNSNYFISRSMYLFVIFHCCQCDGIIQVFFFLLCCWPQFMRVSMCLNDRLYPANYCQLHSCYFWWFYGHFVYAKITPVVICRVPVLGFLLGQGEI